MNTITCLLTVHNKQDLIKDVCLGIIENISELTKQIIIVLDGCNDDSEKIIREVMLKTSVPITYVYTDDVFELRANNEGLKQVTSDYVIIIQDDMIVKEKNFDERMLKPFLSFDDVFAVTSQTAHNNTIRNGTLIATEWADGKTGFSRDIFYVREIANRGPLMYKYSDIKQLGFFDEHLKPSSYDDHDISYRAYKELKKVSGLYWIKYESKPEWGTARQKNVNIHRDAHLRNSKIVLERHSDVMGGVIKNEERKLL